MSERVIPAGYIAVPLTYELPPSERVKTENGKWGTRPWTPETWQMAESERYKFVRQREPVDSKA